MATNSYTEYCVFFGKRPFLAQIGGVAVWISYLGEKRLKPKTIKEYLASLRFFCIHYIRDMAKLEVYGHPILQKITVGF